MADYIEGRRAVAEALAAGVPLECLMVANGIKPERGVEALIAEAGAKGIEIRRVKRAVLDAVSDHGAHQGLIAQARPYAYARLHELVAAAAGKDAALIIALDHVTDPGNLGAIARSAECVGACGLLIPNRRAAQVTAVAIKASAGAVMHIPIAQESNLASSLNKLKEEGFWVIGATEKAEQSIWEAPLEGRIVLVMGSEGDGISRLVLETCDALAALPQAGSIGSLNVAQATTAVAYEWLRRTLAANVPG